MLKIAVDPQDETRRMLDIGGRQVDVRIDRPQGYQKTFQTSRGLRDLQYPLDYGYVVGTRNPQDDEAYDVFLGSGGPLAGRFHKGSRVSGMWAPDEDKWYYGLTPEELEQLKAWWDDEHDPDLVRDWREQTPEEALQDWGITP